MGEVVGMPERTTELASVSMRMTGDGVVRCVLDGMPAAAIERAGHDVPSRLRAIARWLDGAAMDMRAEAAKYAPGPVDKGRPPIALNDFLAADAARYRWLRDFAEVFMPGVMSGTNMLYRDQADAEWDEAIDTAMRIGEANAARHALPNGPRHD